MTTRYARLSHPNRVLGFAIVLAGATVLLADGVSAIDAPPPDEGVKTHVRIAPAAGIGRHRGIVT